MDKIGISAARLVDKAQNEVSQRSQQVSFAKPAATDSDGLPVKFDRDVDLEFPRRLFSAWKPSSGPRELRRPMRAEESAAVAARAAALEIALEPHRDDERFRVQASIAAMLGGFRQMRQQDEDAETLVAITRAVLRDFPTWAIERACLRLARRETKLDPRYPPNDGQIADEVRAILKPYREAWEGARALLAATVEDVPAKRPGTPPASHRGSLPPPVEGERAAMLKADLAARKARREAEQQAAAGAGQERAE